jgi:hypothetical protein
MNPNNDFLFSADHAIVFEFIRDLRAEISIEELLNKAN